MNTFIVGFQAGVCIYVSSKELKESEEIFSFLIFLFLKKLRNLLRHFP